MKIPVLAPLISARAHALRGRNHILNEGLAQQYREFLQSA